MAVPEELASSYLLVQWLAKVTGSERLAQEVFHILRTPIMSQINPVNFFPIYFSKIIFNIQLIYFLKFSSQKF
jgi:hypothetical protein